MASRSVRSDWRAPFPDNTIPTTQEQRSQYVLLMFEALQDTSECKDNKSGYSFRKRWEGGNYYNLQEMEKVSWHMLDIAERLHSQGPASSNIYCEEALKKLKGSRDLTFEQRIHATCAMLKFSKNLCDKVLKGEGIEALVGAPKQKMSGAKTMMIQNQRRQQWIVHGRNEAQLHVKLQESGHQDADEIETPKSAKRKGKESSRSGPAARTRTATGAVSTQVSNESSESEDEPDRLLRHSSTNSLRRRSSVHTSTVDESWTSKKRKQTGGKERALAKRAKLIISSEGKSASLAKND